MQSFCQETEFALNDDVHLPKLKKHHSNHTARHQNNNNHVVGYTVGSVAPSSSTTSANNSSTSGSGITTTAQGGVLGGGGPVASSSSASAHSSTTSSSGGTATHLQQQNDHLAQLLTGNSAYYGHATTIPATLSSPTSPLLAKRAMKGDNSKGGGDSSSDRLVITAEKRSSVSGKTPGRNKFNSIESESLKESGGGGGQSSEGRKSGSGVSPSKKLKKSSSSSSSSKHHHSSSSSSSSSNHHHHHNHHRTSGSSTSIPSTSSGQRHATTDATTLHPAPSTSSSAAAVLSYEKGVNVGYNLFGRLRDLYVELKSETSPQKQSLNLLSTSFLLDKLVSRESLNTLVLNLYPGNKGYSLAFRVVANGQSGAAGNTDGPSGSNSSSAGHSASTSAGSSGSSSRHRLQSGGAVPNTINTGSPGSAHHHHHLPHHINHSLHSPSSSAGQNQFSPSSLSTNTSLTGGGGTIAGDLHETMRWPYEEEELLACIDNEELPLMFVDLFEKRCPQLFYSGCVIVEVRDYRQSFPISTACDKFHVLLRPTNQTLLADVQALTSEGEWSHEEKMALESQLILATAEPLCLDPSPQVGINSINGQHERRMFNSMPIRRHAKKFSQVAINRKRKTDQFTHHFGLELFDFMARHRQRPRLSMGSTGGGGSAVAGSASSSGGNTNNNNNHSGGVVTGATTPTTSLNSFAARLKRAEVQPVRAPSLNFPASLRVPTGEVNVERFAKAFERPRETKDCMPQLVEEYVLETERGNGRVNFIKLSILQRPSNSEYLGMLYLDRDYREDERNGEACQFSLGTRAHANRYIQQFTEIFTEEGRKKVKITHVVPGQQPRVTCTTGLWEQQQQQLGTPGSGPSQPQYQSQQNPGQGISNSNQVGVVLSGAVPGGRGTPQPVQMQLPPPPLLQTTTSAQNSSSNNTPGVVQGGIVSVQGGQIVAGSGGGGVMEQQSQVMQSTVATIGPQGQLLLGKQGQQFSFQLHPQQGQPGQQTVVSGNLGLNKLVQQQQQQQALPQGQQPGQQLMQKPGTPNPQSTVTLTSPSPNVQVQMIGQPQQQQQQGQGQTAQLLTSSQLKLLSNLGPNQYIQFATTSIPQQQTVDGQGSIVGSTQTGSVQQQLHQLNTGQQQQQGPGQQPHQQQPIQYAAIMNCDNNLLKNAISSGSQLGIRNGSLVLLQQNQHTGKTQAVSLVQTSSGSVGGGNVVTSAGAGGGNTNATTQMHVTLPQGTLSQGGRPVLQASGGGVPVLQAQLVGVPITQQAQQQQPIQSPVHTQQAATVVMSPPPPQHQQQQSQVQAVMQGMTTGSGPGGNSGGGIVSHQQPHHSMVQQTQAQLTTKQQNIQASNPAINALFTSLLASANQFEQQQAAAAAAAAANHSTTPTGNLSHPLPMTTPPPPPLQQSTGGKVIPSVGGNSSSNSTIINLLNSAPAAMTNKVGTTGSGSSATTTNPTNPSTPGPPTLVNAFSGLVSPPPSSASSQYAGNSPATPITGTMTNAGTSLVMNQEMDLQHQHLVQQQQLSKPLTKQQMTRLLNGGTESPGLSSPSPSEGSGTEQQQQHQSSVRVTMSALASQLASPPAIMTNSIIQANKHLAAAQAAAAAAQAQGSSSVKVNLSGPGGPIGGPNTIYGVNGTVQHQQQQQMRRTSSTPTPPPPQGPGSVGRREILANIMSPGSDSNHSTASSFSLSMPTLNNLLAAGSNNNNSNTNLREMIGGPGSVGAASSNGGNSMPPSPSPSLVSSGSAMGSTVKQQVTAGGNILTIHASPSGQGGGGMMSNNNMVASNSNMGGVALNNNSMLIDRLTAMANSSSSGGGGVAGPGGQMNVNSISSGVNVPTSILQLQSQSPFLANAMAQATTNVVGSKVLINNNNSNNNNHTNPSQQQQQQQQFTIPAASPKSSSGGGTPVLQNIQLQASPVVSGNVSPQTGISGSSATIMQGQTTGTTTTLNLQGLNLASLQGAMASIPGLQNVQVQIPGLAHTISLSLSNNPSGGGGGVQGGQLVGQQMQASGGGQQTVVLTNPGGGQSMPFAQLVTSAAGLKNLGQQGQKHLVTTSVASGGGQGTPIQLVGLQMNPGSRNLTATVSAASNQSQTATILTSSAGPKLPVHRLSCPQLVRTLSSSGTGATTLKLTQSGGLQVQGGTGPQGGIFVNQSSGLNSILMTPQQLQALQKHQIQSQQSSMGNNVPGGPQVPNTTIVAKQTKHGK